jgi:hypothetical protein
MHSMTNSPTGNQLPRPGGKRLCLTGNPTRGRARHLEASGIATVVMGCAKDIVEHAAVPRFLFSDFPLGNSAGKPDDAASQAQTLELALGLLESATVARTTVHSPLRWSVDAAWKLDYNNISKMSPEELALRRAEFDKQKEIARGNRAA